MTLSFYRILIALLSFVLAVQFIQAQTRKTSVKKSAKKQQYHCPPPDPLLLVVKIKSDGTYWLNRTHHKNSEGLLQILHNALDGRPEDRKEVVFEVSPQVGYGRVLETLDLIRDVGGYVIYPSSKCYVEHAKIKLLTLPKGSLKNPIELPRIIGSDTYNQVSDEQGLEVIVQDNIIYQTQSSEYRMTNKKERQMLMSLLRNHQSKFGEAAHLSFICNAKIDYDKIDWLLSLAVREGYQWINLIGEKK